MSGITVVAGRGRDTSQHGESGGLRGSRTAALCARIQSTFMVTGRSELSFRLSGQSPLTARLSTRKKSCWKGQALWGYRLGRA